MEFHDPTHGGSEPERYWTTANVGEAVPDILSPMCWSFWGPGLEAGGRRAYHDFGILSRHELDVSSDPDQLLTSYFYGRPAMNMDLLRVLFNAMPGMTADDFERDICGHVREGLPPVPSRRRTAIIAAKAPAGGSAGWPPSSGHGGRARFSTAAEPATPRAYCASRRSVSGRPSGPTCGVASWSWPCRPS
jgi:pyruvate,water dikinase